MVRPEIPFEAPNDAVMASPAEVRAMQDWAADAFLGPEPKVEGRRTKDEAPEPKVEGRRSKVVGSKAKADETNGADPRPSTPNPQFSSFDLRPSTFGGVSVRLVRQDYARFGFGQSCMGTPIKLGSKTYRHGLGTHANSEIEVTLPASAVRFEAACGVDNNDSTGGVRGSVQFSVTCEGRVFFQSGKRTASDGPMTVSVEIPKGAKSLTLKVDTTSDGPAYDQSDWADARVVLSSGKSVWLGERPLPGVLARSDLPFSFGYGGKRSEELLPTWVRSSATTELADFVKHVVTWFDTATRLEIVATAKVYRRFPAVDWVLTFENKGSADTPILEDIQALDTRLFLGGIDMKGSLHRLRGDDCSLNTFRPVDTELPPGVNERLAPTGGRSSQNTAFPMFDVQGQGDKGLTVAVGWSGQWAATIARPAGELARLRAGMELTHLVLHPGEKIRTPRILMLSWQGYLEDAHNRWRRLLLFHYSPKAVSHDPKTKGREQPVRVPITLQCFDRYSWKDPTWATEAGQLKAVEAAAKIGCEFHWFDAAWFPGGFPNGVGNWSPKPKEFPNGLGPIGAACQKAGIGFDVWFEPERVAAGSQIATEHPEWVHGGAGGGLFKLDDPKAWRWMTDLLSKRVEEFGLQIYRQDFNMDPLGYWRQNDAPDRQGMTEIRYIEGLYAMWDELVRRHPGLIIDDCASGGRRIDLEMISRSLPLWRSDTGCGPGQWLGAQSQTFCLSRYLPLHATCSWETGANVMRSAATAGIAVQFDYQKPNFNWKEAKAAVAEVKALRPSWYGDYYQLTPAGVSTDEFVAYQMHRSDLNEGFVMAFRRPDCALAGLIPVPRALDPKATYELTFVDEARKATKVVEKGSQILSDGIALRIPKPGQSLLVRYRAVKGKG